jgi:hypothetical protein
MAALHPGGASMQALASIGELFNHREPQPGSIIAGRSFGTSVDCFAMAC